MVSYTRVNLHVFWHRRVVGWFCFNFMHGQKYNLQFHRYFIQNLRNCEPSVVLETFGANAKMRGGSCNVAQKYFWPLVLTVEHEVCSQIWNWHIRLLSTPTGRSSKLQGTAHTCKIKQDKCCWRALHRHVLVLRIVTSTSLVRVLILPCGRSDCWRNAFFSKTTTFFHLRLLASHQEDNTRSEW